MRTITGADRVSIGALAVANVGVGIFLISVGLLPTIPVVHVVVGVVAVLLAFPAAVATITGRLTGWADEGVLVNVAVMTFTTGEVLSLPAAMGQKVGLAILLVALTLATMAVYLRLFGVLRMPRIRGRHRDD